MTTQKQIKSIAITMKDGSCQNIDRDIESVVIQFGPHFVAHFVALGGDAGPEVSLVYTHHGVTLDAGSRGDFERAVISLQGGFTAYDDAKHGAR